MIKAASGVDPFGNNNVIHRGGLSLAGGAATTATTTNNDAAAAKLLPSDKDAAMPSYSRRRPVDDEHYCRRNHHGSRTTCNYAAPQSEFDDLEDEFETLDDEELAALDVDNIVVCQRPIDDDAPYHYEFGNRQGTGDHDGRAPLQTINQQNHHQFGGASSSSSSHAHHGKGQQLLNWYPPDQHSGGNGASSFGCDSDSYHGDGYSGDRRKRFRFADVGGVGAHLWESLPLEPATKEEVEHTKEEESIEMDYSINASGSAKTTLSMAVDIKKVSSKKKSAIAPVNIEETKPSIVTRSSPAIRAFTGTKPSAVTNSSTGTKPSAATKPSATAKLS